MNTVRTVNLIKFWGNILQSFFLKSWVNFCIFLRNSLTCIWLHAKKYKIWEMAKERKKEENWVKPTQKKSAHDLDLMKIEWNFKKKLRIWDELIFLHFDQFNKCNLIKVITNRHITYFTNKGQRVCTVALAASFLISTVILLIIL